MNWIIWKPIPNKNRSGSRHLVSMGSINFFQQTKSVIKGENHVCSTFPCMSQPLVVPGSDSCFLVFSLKSCIGRRISAQRSEAQRDI